jgi:hypothetical protein
MHEGQVHTLGFGWQGVTKDFAEEIVNDRMEPFLGETVAIVL